MSDVKLTARGVFEAEASRQFINVWHRAERGVTFHECRLAFESWDALARFLTGKLMGPFCSLRRMLARR
jgi:hypothetical protein